MGTDGSWGMHGKTAGMKGGSLSSVTLEVGWPDLQGEFATGSSSELRIRLAFLQELQSLIGRLHASSEMLITFVAKELVRIEDSVQILQQKCHAREKLDEFGSHGVARTSKEKSDVCRPTHIYYNSSMKASRGALLTYCNWCGRTGHIERNCWRKKGLCCLCGGGCHALTACSKYVLRDPVRSFSPKCSTCGGGHCGQDCPCGVPSSSTLNDDDTLLDSTSTQSVWLKGKQQMDGSPQLFREELRVSSLSAGRGKKVSVLNTSMGNSSIFAGREKPAEHMVDKSACVSSNGLVPDSIFEDSLISLPQASIDKDYNYCRLEEKEQKMTWDILMEEQDRKGPLEYGKAEECGVILAVQNETWDMSSIEGPDCFVASSRGGNGSRVMKESRTQNKKKQHKVQNRIFL